MKMLALMILENEMKANSGRTAIVTGASSGIGRASAEALARAGRRAHRQYRLGAGTRAGAVFGALFGGQARARRLFGIARPRGSCLQCPCLGHRTGIRSHRLRPERNPAGLPVEGIRWG